MQMYRKFKNSQRAYLVKSQSFADIPTFSVSQSPLLRSQLILLPVETIDACLTDKVVELKTGSNYQMSKKGDSRACRYHAMSQDLWCVHM